MASPPKQLPIAEALLGTTYPPGHLVKNHKVVFECPEVVEASLHGVWPNNALPRVNPRVPDEELKNHKFPTATADRIKRHVKKVDCEAPVDVFRNELVKHGQCFSFMTWEGYAEFALDAFESVQFDKLISSTLDLARTRGVPFREYSFHGVEWIGIGCREFRDLAQEYQPIVDSGGGEVSVWMYEREDLPSNASQLGQWVGEGEKSIWLDETAVSKWMGEKEHLFFLTGIRLPMTRDMKGAQRFLNDQPLNVDLKRGRVIPNEAFLLLLGSF